MEKRHPDVRGPRSEPGALRVLVVHADPDMRSVARRRLESGGYEVATCAGAGLVPDCPMAAGARCPLIDQSDLVWNATDPRAPEACTVVDALSRRFVGVPVVIEVARTRDVLAHRDERRGIWVTATSVTAPRFLHQVDATFRQSGRQP